MTGHVTTTARRTIAASEIKWSESSLAKDLTPAMVTLIDVHKLVVPHNMANSEALRSHLLRTAARHDAALRPAGSDELRKELTKLALVTIPTELDEREARMQLAALMEGLSDVPLDILQEGVRRYIMADGRRFFPRSPGELRAFVSADLAKRRRRALNLRLAHDELHARHVEAERRRKENAAWTQERVDEANEDFRKVGLATRFVYVGDGRARNASGKEAFRDGSPGALAGA